MEVVLKLLFLVDLVRDAGDVGQGLGAVGHELGAKVVRRFRAVDKGQLLQISLQRSHSNSHSSNMPYTDMPRHLRTVADLEKGVVVDLLGKEDDSRVWDSVARIPQDGLVLLLLAVGNESDGVALQADAQPVPPEEISLIRQVHQASIARSGPITTRLASSCPGCCGT